MSNVRCNFCDLVHAIADFQTLRPNICIVALFAPNRMPIIVSFFFHYPKTFLQKRTSDLNNLKKMDKCKMKYTKLREIRTFEHHHYIYNNNQLEFPSEQCFAEAGSNLQEVQTFMRRLYFTIDKNIVKYVQ